MSVALICPVRGCGSELAREGNSFVCGLRHSFDVARSGYINLLQPQDSKAAEPGDSRAAVQARARFLEAFGDPIAAPIAASIRKLARKRPILDLGCGVGFQLDTLRRVLQTTEAFGVDLSAAAIERASKKHRECTFVIANADRSIPFASRSFCAIVSITARRNREEIARLLGDDGVFVAAVPAADDLIELRALAQGDAVLRDRVETLIDEMKPSFEVTDSFTLRRTLDLDRSSIDDLLAATYRGARKAEQQRLANVQSMRVTMSRDIVIFRKT